MKKHVVLIAATVTAALLLPSTGHALGPELLPNPGFEESVLEPSPVPPGTQPQPILPTGWAFEGAAGLFDHSPNVKHAGLRSAAISIPMSGKREICGPEIDCNENPANEVKDETEHVYSVTPHWRTALPVEVDAGASYRFTGWTAYELASLGTGSTASVRWLDANGLPIGQNVLVQKINTADVDTIGWTEVTRASITAPGTATQAHILLGAIDDTFISQVRWDDVSFRKN
jgi:hypothetical protein